MAVMTGWSVMTAPPNWMAAEEMTIFAVGATPMYSGVAVALIPLITARPVPNIGKNGVGVGGHA